MNRKPILRIFAALLLAAAGSGANTDTLSDLPQNWRDALLPLSATDLSGAERLMRETLPEARAEVDALLQEGEPERASLAGAYGRLGALLLLLEVEAQADTCFRNAMVLQPEEFRWPYYAGYLAMMAGNTDQAVVYLEAAADIDPDYPPLYLRLGKARMDRSELARARADLEKIADTDGLVTAANYYLGQIALLERRFEEAAAHLEKALGADPTASEVRYPLAQAYRALGRNDLAREHLARSEPKNPQAEDPLLEQLQGAGKRSLPAFHKGIHAIRQGDYATAAAHFAEGLAVDPENAPARVSHARALFLSGREEEADRALTRALEVAPDHLLANFLKGVLLQQRGDADGAVRQYRRTLELDPQHAGALFYLANLDFSTGRYASAAAAYTRALEASSEIPPARLLELVARYHAGSPDIEIAAGLAGLREQHPDDPVLAYAESRLLADARDPDTRRPQGALELASGLALLHPIPPNQRALALAQAATGDFQQAVRTQRQTLAAASWMAAQREQDLMQEELAAYEQGRLPGNPWPPGDPSLSPPPFDPVAPFRDYPAAVPY